MNYFSIPSFDGDFNKYKNDLNRFKDAYSNNDMSLLNTENKALNIDDLNSLPNGRVSFNIEDIDFECLFIKGEYKKLFVVLAGGIGPSVNLPHFERWSFYKFFGGSCIFIEDPTYKKYSKAGLYTGWFYGEGGISYLEYVHRIVKQVAEFLKVKNDDIIFYGSSSGGYAVLYLSSTVPNSKCISINPQLNLNLPSILSWENAVQTQKILGVDFTSDDKRNDLRPMISSSLASRTIIIINSLSEIDMMQCKSLTEYMGLQWVDFGLNKVNDKLLLWLYEAVAFDVPPHIVQENRFLIYSILNLLHTDISDFESLKKLYLSVTLLWSELYQQIFHTTYWMKETDKLKNELNAL